jgi:hypothetical protein
MTIEEIKQILTNKINELQFHKNIAYSTGDLETYSSLDSKITETQATLDTLDKLNN